MTHSLPRHAAIVGIALAFSLSSALAAETPAQQQLSPDNAAGSYLAARHASTERDEGAAAAYYLDVLKLDPRNSDLLSLAFLSELTDGDIDDGEQTRRPAACDRSQRSHFAARRRHTGA